MASSSDRAIGLSTTAFARIRQGLRTLSPAPPPPIPARLAARLPEPVLTRWHALGSYDRRHLVAVASDLTASAQPDHVVLAGLLHDIGKAGRVTIVDRVAHVLIGWIMPRMRARLAARSRPVPGLDGLHLLLRHAETGADLLEKTGMPAKVVWLVRHHEQPTEHPDLRALVAADHRH